MTSREEDFDNGFQFGFGTGRTERLKQAFADMWVYVGVIAYQHDTIVQHIVHEEGGRSGEADYAEHVRSLDMITKWYVCGQLGIPKCAM